MSFHHEKLPVKLSPDELATKSQELASAVVERETYDETRKDAVARFREELKTMDAGISDLAACVRTGEERREVEVHWVPIPERGVMVLERLDTYEVVRTRPMSAAELEDARQGKLFSERLEAMGGDGETPAADDAPEGDGQPGAQP